MRLPQHQQYIFLPFLIASYTCPPLYVLETNVLADTSKLLMSKQSFHSTNFKIVTLLGQPKTETTATIKAAYSHTRLMELTSVKAGLRGPATAAGGSCSKRFNAAGSLVGALHVKF